MNDAVPLVWSDARDRNTRCCFNWRVEIADVRFVEVDGHDIVGSTAATAAVGDARLHIRAGIHVGEIEVRPNSDITGIAVNLAARIEPSAPDAAIYVSSTVRDMLLGGETCFEDRGGHVLKGLPCTGSSTNSSREAAIPRCAS